MHLHLDMVKQHSRSNMHQIVLLAEADTTTQIGQGLLKARSHCKLNAHSIRFNAHWFAFTLSRRECALSQSGLKPVWLNPLSEVV